MWPEIAHRRPWIGLEPESQHNFLFQQNPLENFFCKMYPFCSDLHLSIEYVLFWLQRKSVLWVHMWIYKTMFRCQYHNITRRSDNNYTLRWPKLVKHKKIFKAVWNKKILAEHCHFFSNLHHSTVHHSTKFKADTWNPQRVTAITLSFRPISGLSWKISKFCGMSKNLLIMSVCNSHLFHGTMYHSGTKFQADTWNLVELKW